MKVDISLYRFSDQVNSDPQAAPLPAALLTAAETAADAATSPSQAEAAFARFAPELARHAAEARLFMACGMLLEKRRCGDCMLRIWNDLHDLFPDELLPVRMLMRWYRRLGQLDEGLQRLRQLVPDMTEAAQVRRRMQGYLELDAYLELDNLMQMALVRFPANRALKVKYITALMKQNRLLDAVGIARQISDRSSLDPKARDLLAMLEKRSSVIADHQIADISEVMGRMADAFRTRAPRPLQADGIGPFVLFTGQLGAGGAERQLTRIAALYQRAWDRDQGSVGRHRLTAPPAVCVRHVTPVSGADFFLPVLHKAGVDTTVMTDLPDDDAALLGPARAGVHDLMPLLPNDIQINTRKLIPYFRARRFETVYLWQDGGVLAAALAALLADVPRIVASFRGLPPNLRPELMRPQMPAFFRALAHVPGVQLTANSNSTARAYETWLGLPGGMIGVVHNAVPPHDPAGAAEDAMRWQRIVAASPACTRTVLGIFRFDHNKRPDFWIEAAADHLRRNPDTRFVILGAGHEFARCRQLRDALGLQDRVFLPGTTQHVGFYLARADLLMHLSRMEGLPNVLIEAQMAGVPVLATPAGGTAEIVCHGQTGVILPDAEAPQRAMVTNALGQLLSDPPALAAMGARARGRAAAKFDPEQVLQATLELFASPQAATRAA